MGKNRIEAFSDGVIAIILTIMVLEMKAPSGSDLDSLRPVLPAFLSYVLSFIFVGIYWNNHHHVFHAVQRVSGMTLWANLHLLFWLSLIPFVTRWMGESAFGTWPVVAYGLVMFMSALAWDIERRILVSGHAPESLLARAMNDSRKEWVSVILYVLAIGTAFLSPWIACALYCMVAAIWIVPDRRIERQFGTGEGGSGPNPSAPPDDS